MKYQFLEKGDPKVCEVILRSLPDWFGIEESTLSYIRISKELPMIIVSDHDQPIAFVSLKNHGQHTSEVYVMGVSPTYHRKGIGKRLILEAEKYLAEKGFEFLQVKTLSPDRESQAYKKTRLFYTSMGFKLVEVFPTLWGEANPCQLMIKSISK